jgi:general secretion pathway protein A
MYLNFYNLKREPFNITPDPEMLYLSPSHKEALAAVICGVNRRKGFVAITGEVGVGKTTIIRAFLEKVDKQNVKAIYVFNANISFKSLLRIIFQNIGKAPQAEEVPEMVNQLHMILIDEYRADRNLVLIIDEAQNMPVETLENLRMLSNLETSTDKLIQIVLSGQPEFEQKLNQHTLRQLNQRIAIRVKILPLSAKESLEYINHRLFRSSIKDAHPFTSGALHRIVGKAGGIPRVINIFCDNCLVTAFGKQQKKVTSRVAREIIAEQTGEIRNWHWIRFACITALLAGVSVFWIYSEKGRFLPVPVPGISVNKSVVPVAERSGIRTVQTASAKPAEVLQETGGAQPVPEKNEKTDAADTSGNTNGHIVRVARRGDTLARLVSETYGSVDRKLMGQVKELNPGITNVNLILEGEKIYFPARDK